MIIILEHKIYEIFCSNRLPSIHICIDKYVSYLNILTCRLQNVKPFTLCKNRIWIKNDRKKKECIQKRVIVTVASREIVKDKFINDLPIPHLILYTYVINHKSDIK